MINQVICVTMTDFTRSCPYRVLHAKKKMLVISNWLLIIRTSVGQQRQLLLSSIFVLWLSPCTYWRPVLSLTASLVITSQWENSAQQQLAFWGAERRFLILSTKIHWPAVCVITKSKHLTSTFSVNRSLNIHSEKNAIESKEFFFQKHVYHEFKSICYRISNIFIGSCIGSIT